MHRQMGVNFKKHKEKLLKSKLFIRKIHLYHFIKFFSKTLDNPFLKARNIRL